MKLVAGTAKVFACIVALIGGGTAVSMGIGYALVHYPFSTIACLTALILLGLSALIAKALP